MKTKNGFTLVEVVLAITILASLTVLVGTSLSRALKAKRKIQAEVEDVSQLRDAMRLIKNDINQAYNHFDYEDAIIKVSQKKTPTTNNQNRPPNQPPGFPPQNPYGAGYPNQPVPTADTTPKRENVRVSPLTQFIGTEKDLNFVTMNNGRINTEDLQADFIEVGYSVEGCKKLSEDDKTNPNGQCLYRRQQKILDQDVTRGGTKTSALSGVSQFSLKYMGEGKLDWSSEWKTKNQFPEAVEVNLEIEREFDGKTKKYSLQYIIPVHFPNNQKGNSSNQTTNQNTGTTTGGPTQ